MQARGKITESLSMKFCLSYDIVTSASLDKQRRKWRTFQASFSLWKKKMLLFWFFVVSHSSWNCCEICTRWRLLICRLSSKVSRSPWLVHVDTGAQVIKIKVKNVVRKKKIRWDFSYFFLYFHQPISTT